MATVSIKGFSECCHFIRAWFMWFTIRWTRLHATWFCPRRYKTAAAARKWWVLCRLLQTDFSYTACSVAEISADAIECGGHSLY